MNPVVVRGICSRNNFALSNLEINSASVTCPSFLNLISPNAPPGPIKSTG